MKDKDNAFYKLEKTNEDKLKADLDLPRLEKLIEIKAKDKEYFKWNSLLRKRMRDLKQTEKLEKASINPNFGLKIIEKLD